EIDLFELYINRLDSKTHSESFETALKLEMSPGRKTKAGTPERQQLLTLEQKCDVARSVHKQMAEDLKRAKDHSERELDNYKATLEEADIHLAEVKKRMFPSVTMSAEKVSRYTEDKVRAKENLIEKLYQKNAALLEMGEGLTALDFEQLKFGNLKCRKRLDEQNLKHMELKLLAGKTLHVLNSEKEKLQTLTHESDVLSSDIALRMNILVKIEEETKQAEEEQNKAEVLNRKLRRQLADFHVPRVLQYIKVKESHGQLQKSVKEWERKVEIAEMAIKTHTKSWAKLRIAAGARPVPARHVAIDAGLYGF
uniref:Cilia- and flagella-associated protein 263 n=1 Tax=Cyprinus carpio TaxID=7962 RepID=A0A8C2HPJ8_CYPCA